jgi:hypothetical protein
MSHLFTSYPIGSRRERYRLTGNRHLQPLVESITMNTGEPFRDVKESESRERKNLEYSEALTGSQSGHSTRSTGKLCTGGRATGSRDSSTNYSNRTR